MAYAAVFNPEKFREQIAELNARRKQMRAAVTEAIVDALADYPDHMYKLKTQKKANDWNNDHIAGYRFKEGKIWWKITKGTDWIYRGGDNGWYYVDNRLSDLTTIYEDIINKK